MSYKVFVINPGSTSTKLAYFDGETKLFETNVFHDAPELAKFATINDQLPYRKAVIQQFLKDNGIDLTGVDAIVGRCGACVPCKGGVYEITDLLIRDCRNAAGGVEHPSNLGVQLAAELQKEYGGRAFTVDSPKTDEFREVARITGVKGIYRTSNIHALNIKGTAQMHCRLNGLDYAKSSFVVCHIDGGITISALKGGRIIDATDNAGGEGPFTPTRTGALPVSGVLDTYSGKDLKESKKILTRSGGFVSWFGTSNSDKVHEMAEEGDRTARLVWDAMVYNICKYIGSMAAVLKGRVDGIICGGGLLRFEDIKQQIEESCGWIAPVSFYPGEVEHEAMAAGAIRVLKGEEIPLTYTGEPVWKGL